MYRDNGEGIPKEHLGAVFERFVKVDNSFARKAEGSGMGLAVTKSLVELLDGKIWVKSKEREGSTFFVELPVQKIKGEKSFLEIKGYDSKERVKIEFSDVYLDAELFK